MSPIKPPKAQAVAATRKQPTVVTAPQLPLVVKLMPKRKRAKAMVRGGIIEVVMPKHWSRDYQKMVEADLARRVQEQFNKDYALVAKAKGPFLTFTDKPDLHQWVEALNAETFGYDLADVRIGWSKYSHLAQMNTRTRVMTISCHSLNHVPESALRYLVLHELAHLKIPNHSPAFWALVKTFVPDAVKQRKLMSAVHRIRLYEAEVNQAQPAASLITPKPAKPRRRITSPPVEPALVQPKGFGQLLLQLFFNGAT